MLLRPRQEQFVEACIRALDANDNTLGVAPTGAGKTVMLSAVTGHMRKRGLKRTLIVQHRDELVEQNRNTFHRFNGNGIPSGLITADRKDWLRDVVFGMVQTVGRKNNLEKITKPFDMLVVDEAHHIAAPTYRAILDRLRELNPETKLLGVTATPNRGDKKGIRFAFDNVADQITLGELIRTGALVPPRTFVLDIGVQEDLRKVKKTISDFDMSEVAKIMDRQVLNDAIVEHWKEKAGGRQTVVFASTVDHALHVTEAFSRAGVSARIVTGETPDAERADLLAAFDRGEFQVIVNVAVLTEGWDCQPVSCVVLLRPSSYASTMIQMIGRGLRRMDPERYPYHPPKSDCIVLDFGTSILTHGTLEQNVDLDPDKTKAEPKECPGCGSKIPMFAHECPICGYVFVVAGESGVETEKETLDSFVMTEVDVFTASPFRWEELWDGSVLIATAFEAWAVVLFYGDTWVAVSGSKTNGIHVLSRGDRLLCLSVADDFMRENASASEAGKSKRWLHMPASEKQLQHLGLDPMSGEAVSMSRYRAACFLTWKFNGNGIRSRVNDLQQFGRAA